MQKSISFLFIFLILSGGSCIKGSRPTPEKYRYVNSFLLEDYEQDSLRIVHQIRQMIDGNRRPYYSDGYDSLTEIYVDSILYSPAKDKIAVFVIAKNSNDKLLTRGDPLEFHYNANCFIGEKSTTNWEVRWFQKMNFPYYRNYEKVSRKIRFRYFNNLVEFKGQNGNSHYKYNLDDIRFWDGPVWDSTTVNNPLLYESGNAE